MKRNSGGKGSSWTSSLAVGAQDVTAFLEDAWQQTPPNTWPLLAGTVAFGSTLALSTLTQKQLLGISTGTVTPIPTLFGVFTVCFASLAAHQAAIAAYQRTHPATYQVLGRSVTKPQRQPFVERMVGIWNRPITMGEAKRKAKQVLFQRDDDDYLNLGVVHLPMHTVRVCVIGLLAFKVLRGRFWAIAPSSYTHIGSFARPALSLPAGEGYASSSKRALLEKLGKRVGCHTCGTHGRHTLVRRFFSPFFRVPTKAAEGASQSTFQFVGDHMPPKSVAEQMNRQIHRRVLRLLRLPGGSVSFRFYPQCVDCSGKQGALLAAATAKLRAQGKESLLRPVKSLAEAGGGSNAHFHGLTPRWNHLAGGVIAGVAVSGSTPYDIIKDNNRRRYRNYQADMQKWVREQRHRWLKKPLKPPTWQW